jgi:hypothetical protein
MNNYKSRIKRKFRSTIRKLWPTGADILLNLKALRNEDKSQFGEQKLLLQFVEETKALAWPKLYLELGAAYPIFHSNSYALSKVDFRGISFDADERYAFQWQLLRPRDRFESAAIITSTEEKTTILHKFPSSHSSLNTINFEQNLKWQTEFQSYSKPVLVPAKNIKNAYYEFKDTYGNFPTIILSDLEGIDKEIISNLLSNLPTNYYPKAILLEVEEFFLEEDNLITNFYELYDKAGLSLLMVLK